MAKGAKKKKLRPRLPLEAALKLRSYAVSPRKGRKGYDRKLKKEQNRKVLEEAFLEEKD